MEFMQRIQLVIGLLFTVCYAYQFFYLTVPFFRKDKAHKTAVFHRYAVLICARNEAAVIGHLIDSIRRQDYP